MVKIASLPTVAALAFAGSALARHSSPRLHNRQSSGSILESDYQNGATAPGARPGDAAGQTVVIDNNGGHDDNSQRDSCPTIFIGSAAVGGSFSTGWTDMPQVLGFDTMRDLTVGNNVVQPYIIEIGKDPSQIKRVVITQPGLPRDYWKYANLVRNSLLCASVNSTMGINRDEILIAAPTWFSTNDASAGSAQSNDLRFSGGNWATGVNSAGPNGEAISSFEALDDLVNKFFDKSTYPNVQQVVIAGHSLGGSFTQHYAMLRKANSAQDGMISYFVGNPGSYVWPTSDRPVQNPGGNCAGTQDEWGYGLQDLPPTAAAKAAPAASHRATTAGTSCMRLASATTKVVTAIARRSTRAHRISAVVRTSSAGFSRPTTAMFLQATSSTTCPMWLTRTTSFSVTPTASSSSLPRAPTLPLPQRLRQQRRHPPEGVVLPPPLRVQPRQRNPRVPVHSPARLPPLLPAAVAALLRASFRLLRSFRHCSLRRLLCLPWFFESILLYSSVCTRCNLPRPERHVETSLSRHRPCCRSVSLGLALRSRSVR